MVSAAVAVALLGMFSADASALALGPLRVQSALGEPLRAEIEITEITAAEAEGLKVKIANADAFQAAGVTYNPALSDVRASVQRRANGRYVVRLAGNRSMNDPFIDVLLEANSNTSRIVRDYTVLLDPPGSRPAAPAGAAPIAPSAPQISSPSVAPRSSAPPPTTVRRAPPAPAAAPTPAPEAAAPSGAGARSGSGDQQVTVQRGDTASKIAGAYKPAEVSLDQMLVALLRANPDAFIAGNINRVKAGAVLQLPSAAEAAGVPAAEARSTLTAQSRDFNSYRRRLAENAPTSSVAAADRQASGKLQANVEDRNAAAVSPDKLTISQGGTAEDKIAQSRQAQESSNRMAELSKNIDELNKLQAASTAAPAAAASPASPEAKPAAGAAATPPADSQPAAGAAASAAGVAPATGATGATGPAGATGAAGAPGATGTPGAAAQTPPAESAAPAVAAPAAEPKPVVQPIAPPPERGFFADLLENPLVLAAAALLALLIAFLLYRVFGRKRQDAGESVFLESRMPKDSFFGASGGESVDTKNRANSVISSLSYSPSQLDAGDVDPVAEADVYLAYGRDLQAEEILREALRVTPERTAVHLKLLEIHAKRRDLRAYEALAADVHQLTGGTGNDWNRVVEMGKDLDPGNPLYETNARSVTAAETAAFAGTLAAATAAPASVAAAPAPAPAPQFAAAPPPAFVPSVAPLDFDLDLGKPSAPAPLPVSASLPPAAAPAAFAQTPRNGHAPLPNGAAHSNGAVSAAAPSSIDLEQDFDTAPGALEPATRPAPLSARPEEERTLRAGLPGDSGFIEFDMSALSGLAPRHPVDPTEPGRLEPLDDGADSPHAVKLSLARELQALGDVEGARSLVEEVESESSGELRTRAKQLLAQLH